MAFLRLHHRAPTSAQDCPLRNRKTPWRFWARRSPLAEPSSLGGDCRAFEAPEARRGAGRLKRDAQSWPESRWDSLLFWDSFPDSSSRVRTPFCASEGLTSGCPKCKKPRNHLDSGASCGGVVGDIGLTGSKKKGSKPGGTHFRTLDPEFVRSFSTRRSCSYCHPWTPIPVIHS